MGSHVKDFSGPSLTPANGLRATKDRPLSVSGTDFKGAGHFSYDHYVPLLTVPDNESREAEMGEGQPYPDRESRYAKRGPKQSP